LPVHARESVRVVVNVSVGNGRAARQDGALRFGQAVAYRVIRVMEVAAIGVVGFFEAIQRVVDVGDGRGHHRACHRPDVGAAARLEGVEVGCAPGAGVRPVALDVSRKLFCTIGNVPWASCQSGWPDVF